MKTRLAGYVEGTEDARTDEQVKRIMSITQRVVELLGECEDQNVLADVTGSIMMSVAMRFAQSGLAPEGFVMQCYVEVLQAMPEIKKQHEMMWGSPPAMQ